MTSRSSAAQFESCLVALVLTNDQDAQRLLTTQLGDESALAFCLRRLGAAQPPIETMLIMPDTLAQPWRDLIAMEARAARLHVVLAHEENLWESLLYELRQRGLIWTAIVPATSIFVERALIQSCLPLLYGAGDYLYGPTYPPGAQPLIVSRNVVAAHAARPSHPAVDGSELARLLDGLSAFVGLTIPSPSRLHAPDIDLAMETDQQAVELARIARRLWACNQPLTTASMLQELRARDTRRLRATFRVAHRRPRADLRPADAAPRTVLCIGLRANKLSGGDTSLYNLLTSLDQEQFRPILATPTTAGAIAVAAQQRALPTVAVPLLSRTEGVFSELLPGLLELTRFANRHHADLIFANSSSVGALSAMAAFVRGLPLVTRVIEEIDRTALEASLSMFADRIVVPSQYIARQCQALGVPQERLVVVHEGVDASWFATQLPRTNLRQQCGIPADAPLIGVVSRLDDPRKALERAVQALAHIVAARPTIHLAICGKTGLGTAQSVTRLVHCAEQLGLSSHLHLVGFFGDMRPIYEQFDLLLHPAPHEPFGLVLTEAMARGVPVVAVRGGGVPEQIIDGQTGLLVERSEARTLAQAAIELLDRPQFRQRLGKQAREHVQQRFTAERFAREITTVFRDVLHQHAGV